MRYRQYRYQSLFGIVSRKWKEVIDKAVELGHGEAALWIKPNFDKYFDGMERGFEFEGEVIESTDEE
jgi:hypothetical protein